MATGAGLGGVVSALLPLVGIVTILHGRRKRKRGAPEPLDQDLEKRREAARESERRMAAYLAQQRSGGYDAMDDDEQEIRR